MGCFWKTPDLFLTGDDIIVYYHFGPRDQESKTGDVVYKTFRLLRFPNMFYLCNYRLRIKGSLKQENIPNLRRYIFCDWFCYVG